MGAALGALGAEVRYRVGGSRLTVTPRRRDEPRRTARRCCTTSAASSRGCTPTSPELPFDLNGGFVGYLGYELKADCGAAAAHEAELPDAFLLLADRLVVDRPRARADARARAQRRRAPTGSPRAEAWLDATAAALDDLPALDEPPDARPRARPRSPSRSRRGREHYLANIETCKRLLEAGESYEICLTNTLTLPALARPVRALPRAAPRQPGAVQRLPADARGRGPELLARALPARRPRPHGRGQADQGHRAPRTPTRPPTRPPATRCARSPKDRAEHLMIVDLLRNDLGLVSQIGSVHVPKLMDVESYETVHQLVSTIRGRLRDDVDVVDAIRATFPGGSMTGAPKLRTMEIIDALEGAPRGVYSGALGYLALNGTADLSIVIRTLVATRGRRDDRHGRRDRDALRGRGRVRRDAAQGPAAARRGQPERRGRARGAAPSAAQRSR